MCATSFERFDFHTQVERLAKANLLYLVTEKFAGIDLHPDVVSNEQMGTVFEELIRKTPPLDLEAPGLNHGDPVIRVLHRYPVSRPLAYLIECALGQGTLIISALNLDQTLPEARYLLAQMCRHAATGTPRPMMELTDTAVARLISATALP